MIPKHGRVAHERTLLLLLLPYFHFLHEIQVTGHVSQTVWNLMYVMKSCNLMFERIQRCTNHKIHPSCFGTLFIILNYIPELNLIHLNILAIFLKLHKILMSCCKGRYF